MALISHHGASVSNCKLSSGRDFTTSKFSLVFKELKKDVVDFSHSFTLGQNPTFYPEITRNLMFEDVNFMKNETLKM